MPEPDQQRKRIRQGYDAVRIDRHSQINHANGQGKGHADSQKPRRFPCSRSIESFHRLTPVSQTRKVPIGAGPIAVAVARLSLLPRFRRSAANPQVRSKVWLLLSVLSKSPRCGRGSSPRKAAQREARQEHCPAASALLAAANCKGRTSIVFSCPAAASPGTLPMGHTERIRQANVARNSSHYTTLPPLHTAVAGAR